MIELLLQAERALMSGLVEPAERLYLQTLAADPRNSIAVVGLARVALERADDRRAYGLARRALAIDPRNAAADRLATRMAEVLETRGEAIPNADEIAAIDLPGASPTGRTTRSPGPPTPLPPATPGRPPSEAPAPRPTRRRGLLERLRRVGR